MLLSVALTPAVQSDHERNWAHLVPPARFHLPQSPPSARPQKNQPKSTIQKITTQCNTVIKTPSVFLSLLQQQYDRLSRKGGKIPLLSASNLKRGLSSFRNDKILFKGACYQNFISNCITILSVQSDCRRWELTHWDRLSSLGSSCRRRSRRDVPGTERRRPLLLNPRQVFSPAVPPGLWEPPAAAMATPTQTQRADQPPPGTSPVPISHWIRQAGAHFVTTCLLKSEKVVFSRV